MNSDHIIHCPECGTNIPLPQAFASDYKNQLSEQYRTDLARHSEKIRNDIEDKVRLEMIDLKQSLTSQTLKVRDFENQELSLRQKLRDVEDRGASQKLELQRQLDCQKEALESQIHARLLSEYSLKVSEKDSQLDQMRKQIDDLKRKAEQGSSQRHGEVLEVAIEQKLVEIFSLDCIEPVPKGIRGADIVQKVITKHGKQRRDYSLGSKADKKLE